MSNEVTPYTGIEERIDFSKGIMHRSFNLGPCQACKGKGDLTMISGIIKHDLIAQIKCSYCYTSSTYRKELDASDYLGGWSEEQRQFERNYKSYQVWPPVEKAKVLDFTSYQKWKSKPGDRVISDFSTPVDPNDIVKVDMESLNDEKD